MSDSLRDRVRRRLSARRADAGTPPAARPAGPVPEVVRETTHYGPQVDELVERQRRRQRPPGVDADYDLVRDNFDHYHYALQSPELAERPGADPVGHFLKAGARAKASPHPDFSLRKYLQRHPEQRASEERSPYLQWLKHGRAAGEIADPADGVEPMADLLGLTPQRLVEEVVALRTDMTERLRTGTLGEMFAKAVELEPLIGEAWRETAARTNQLPLRNESVARAARAIHVAHEAAGFRRARVVLVVDRPRSGDDLDLRLVRSLVTAVPASELVVVYTDAGGSTDPGRFPDGVREVDFFTPLEGVGPQVRDQALVSLLRSFCADALVNLDSELLYAALPPFGKALVTSERLFLCFPATADGTTSRTGLRWLYPTSEYVEGLFTDDPAVRDRLGAHFLLTGRYLDRFHVVGSDGDPALARVLLRDATDPTGPKGETGA